MEILQDAGSVAVQNCECRSHYKRCNHPLEVCFLLNEVADKFVSKEAGRPVSLSEAAAILKNANESGIVHLSFYMLDYKAFAFFS